MFDLELELDTRKVDKLLLSLEEATDTTRILDEALALLLNRIRTRFLAKQDPDGDPWVPSEAGLKREKSGFPGTMFDTGNLFRSIQGSGTGDREPTRKISTDVEYGAYHQYGTAKLIPRPFLGFNDSDADLIQRLIVKRIGEVLLK